MTIVRFSINRAMGLAGVLLLGSLSGEPALAQQDIEILRPVPGPVVPPGFYRDAVERGTRSPDGRPGPRYWQPHTSYRIEATLDPETGRVTGRSRIVFENRAPGSVLALFLYLHQNLHAAGAIRSEAQEVTGGMELTRVAVDGAEIQQVDTVRAGASYAVDGTMLTVLLPRPLPAGASVRLALDWGFVTPQNGAGRMGYSSREMYFLAYWFPKVAVLDDLRGWDVEPYLAGSEFYDSYGDYEVSLTVPSGWTVMATGELQNPLDVWSGQTLERLEAASSADTVVHIATREDRTEARVTVSRDRSDPSDPGGQGGQGSLTYRFSAEGVRDFTWSASNVHLWDATSAAIADRDGDGVEDRVAIHTFWREGRAPLWVDQALYAKHSIEFHSRYTGFAYPWPHMTSVEGADIIGGGMEFPMLTLIGPYDVDRTAQDLYNVTSHELAHMWIPMILGTNEKRYAWMDEGFTTFLENQSRPDYWPGDPADSLDVESYLLTARAEGEQRLMNHGDYYEPGASYGTASYAKPATLLVTLRGLLGADVLEEAYRTYISEWAFKHPAPWDFFNTIERVAGRDLDWFWNTWYFETWTLDHAVAGVTQEGGTTTIVIEDRGFAPMPTRVRIWGAGGQSVDREIPVSHWLGGEVRAVIELDGSLGEISRVEIDPDRLFPDLDRTNNVWARGIS